MDVGSKAHREAILDNAKSLKGKAEPWILVYLKKDAHFVEHQENKRLWKKKDTLKKSFPGKDIKIIKGKLQIDGQVVDQNALFG